MNPVARRGVIASAGSAGGVEFAVGSFTAPTSTGTQAVTGVGFTPKAIMFWSSGSGEASGTWDSVYGVQQSIGFTSGPTESYAVSGASQDGAATSDTGRRVAAKAITHIHPDGTSLLAEADLSSFDADGFTLNWTAAVTSNVNPIMMFLAIGGADVSAKVVNWTSPSATGNHSVTGVGFQPDCVLHGSPRASGALPLSVLGHEIGFGAMDSGGGQWVNAVGASDGLSTSETARYQRTDKCLVDISAPSTVSNEAEFVSMDAGGFTVNFTTVAAAGYNFISLCLKGVSAKVGSVTLNTDGSDAAATASFDIDALLATTVAAAASTAVQAQAFLSTGAATSAATRMASQTDQDNLSTTDADSIWNNSDLLFTSFAGSAAETGVLQAGPGWGTTSLTLDQTNAANVATEVCYLALGAA